MAEKHSISRVSDRDQSGAGTGDEQQNLTLTGICTQTERQCTNRDRQAGGTDNYVDFGPTSRDEEAERARASGGDRTTTAGGERVTVRQGDTLWKLAEQKYGGKHPLEAIYEANGMHPKVNQANGKIEMTDPKYGPGQYVLPDEKDIPALTRQYRQKVEEQGRSSQQRVGTGEEASQVKLIYGDTFERMGRAKYGKDVPAEAIYEANNLQPRVENGCVKEPIYYAGKTYTLPAEKDIPDLVRRYWERCGHPEKCPPQYRKEGAPTGNDNYGDYGGTEVGKPRPTGEGRERRDTKFYNEGYEDGYRDGMKRGKACACGGGGCESCRGKGHGHAQRREERVERREERVERREPERVVRAPRVDAGCPNCGGNGCDACSGRARRGGVVYSEDRYYDQRQRHHEINPAVPLAIMGMVLNGVMGNRHHHRDHWDGGYRGYDYEREAWEQQRARQMWQRQHHGGRGYDSEYGYGRRQQRYQDYQQYQRRYWNQGW